jgi:hypothetical protein
MTFFKWDGKPKKRVTVETVGNKRVIHVDASEAMRIMEAKWTALGLTPEERARQERELDALIEAEEAAENEADDGDDDGLAKAQHELQLIHDAITAHNLACRTCDTMAGKKTCAEGTRLRQLRKEARQLVDAALAQLP